MDLYIKDMETALDIASYLLNEAITERTKIDKKLSQNEWSLQMGRIDGLGIAADIILKTLKEQKHLEQQLGATITRK